MCVKTTSNAALFSATNKTFLPLEINSVIIFVMVCDFPVPGGPSSTKLLPLIASWIATSCDASVSSAWK